MTTQRLRESKIDRLSDTDMWLLETDGLEEKPVVVWKEQITLPGIVLQQ